MSELPISYEDDLLRLAFDLAPSGVLAVGPGGGILLANREAERMFGSEPGGMVGRTVDEFVPPAVRGGHAAHRDGFFVDPEHRPMGAGRDLFALRPDGTEFPVEIGLRPVRLPSGVVVVATIVDITQRRAAEQARRDLDERSRQTQKLESLGTLAGGIAHDFNNILLGIVGYTELAQRALKERSSSGSDAIGDDLDQVLRAAERGRQLVRRILMFTRQTEVTRAPLSLDRVVRESADLLRASLPTTIQIRLTVESGLPQVLADETLIHQIVLNLGTNAAHAMEHGGELGISLASADVSAAFAAAREGMHPGRHVRLSVVDNGAGMTPEVRARLFEPFFTTKPVGRGTGLGLSVILGIVRSLEGGIEITSEPGKGTRVDLWLPEGPAPSHATHHSPAGAGDSGAKLHALLVEDEPALAVMERRQLESLGLRVTVHTSSEEALADFRARPEAFDLLVTDNTMPHMTGLQLAREVTQIRRGLPVLMVSGYADHAEPAVLQANGITALLPKPHSAAELQEALRRIQESP